MTNADRQDGLDRRSFLGVVLGAFLTACSSEAADEATGTTSASATSSATTARSPSSATTSTTTAAAEVEAIDAPPVDLPAEAFALGVASGDPDHESVVLWARLVGDLPDSFELVWELATDAAFAQLVARGLSTVTAETGHSVHAIATGLAPDARYFYRFRAGALVSPVGSTRTLPTTQDRRPVTLAVSSCQARPDGAWAAHRDIAESDVDAVLWLGDYIYGDHRTLDAYRTAYAEYRSDQLLQACHAAVPWISFIDDHEILNDFDATVDPSRRAAALQAWWEHQPTRLPPPGADGSLTVYRSLELGGVARLIGLDVRQYADDSGLLGPEQWAFVEEAARHDAPTTLIASPVNMCGVRDLEGDALLTYSIDGWPEERRRMANLVAAMPEPLIVSGDLHTSLVGEFSADPLDRDAPTVAVEIMAPAISSAFPERFAALAPFLPLVNPQLRNVEVENGWLELTLTESGPTAVFHYVDEVTDPASPITLRPIPNL